MTFHLWQQQLLRKKRIDNIDIYFEMKHILHKANDNSNCEGLLAHIK